MYTVCWSDMSGDHYERCEDRRAVADLLERNGLQDDEDVLIFAPDADDCLITPEDLFASL